MQKVIRHELVEIAVPKGSTLTKYQIPDLPNLRNVHIFGLQFFGKVDITKGIQTGFDVLPYEKILRTGFITLVNYGGKEFLKQSPCVEWHTTYTQDNAGAPPLPALVELEWNAKGLVGQKVNFPKSYIEFSGAPSDPAIDQCILFSVFYSLPVAEEKQESGYSFGKRS